MFTFSWTLTPLTLIVRSYDEEWESIIDVQDSYLLQFKKNNHVSCLNITFIWGDSSRYIQYKYNKKQKK